MFIVITLYIVLCIEELLRILFSSCFPAQNLGRHSMSRHTMWTVIMSSLFHCFLSPPYPKPPFPCRKNIPAKLETGSLNEGLDTTMIHTLSPLQLKPTMHGAQSTLHIIPRFSNYIPGCCLYLPDLAQLLYLHHSNLLQRPG